MKAHVRDVDPVVARVGERIHARLQEEEARVLAGPQVHERHVGGYACDPEAVDRRGNSARHVGAVRVLVDVVRVVARPVALVGTRAVDEWDVDGEVPAQRPVEVGRDVRVVSVDPRVEDAYKHAVAALLLVVGAVRRRVDHPHVPLQRSQWLGQVVAVGPLPGRPFSGAAFVPRAARLSVRSCSSETFGRSDGRALPIGTCARRRR